MKKKFINNFTKTITLKYISPVINEITIMLKPLFESKLTLYSIGSYMYYKNALDYLYELNPNKFLIHKNFNDNSCYRSLEPDTLYFLRLDKTTICKIKLTEATIITSDCFRNRKILTILFLGKNRKLWKDKFIKRIQTENRKGFSNLELGDTSFDIKCSVGFDHVILDKNTKDNIILQLKKMEKFKTMVY